MSLQYLSNEEEECTFVIVELILPFNQMWTLHPEVSTLYPDSSVFVICGRHEIRNCDLIRITSPPSQLLKLDIPTQTLTPVDGQVSCIDFNSTFRHNFQIR